MRRSNPRGSGARLGDPRMTLGIVKRSEADILNWLSTEVGFIEGLCAYEGQPIKLEPYQHELLTNSSRFRWVTKSRQIGFSFGLSLEALARCHLRSGHDTVFVSYSQDEAKERIITVREVHESLPLAYQKKIIVDAKTEIAFESNSASGKQSRIFSVPSKPPRGKKGDIVLDELAHYVNDHDVYGGSTALILRSRGQLTGCSTPLGRRGIFWEIAKEELRRYPHHSRQVVPWWLCSFLSNDVARAAKDAPDMDTETAAHTFGTDELLQQFDSLSREYFEQEFCGFFIDESYSFYPYDLILPCTKQNLRIAADITDVPKPQGRMVAAFDVGREHDKSELAVFEQKGEHFICRYLKSYHRTPFAEQETDLRRVLDVLPIARLSIDQSGIGRNLAENLARDYPQVIPETFTNATKEQWCTDFKILLQHGGVDLPRDREVVAQIHSIKRRVLPSGKIAFDAERTKGGHADKFWAIVMACQKERSLKPENAGGTVRVRVLG